MKEKKEIRNEILKIRKELSAEKVRKSSAIICNIIRVLDIYRASDDICLYMPVRNEVDVTYLAESGKKDGKRIWLPAVKDGTMSFYIYDEKTSFVRGSFGIREPDGGEMLIPGTGTLVVMPGAVFSEDHDRIGYGGGYYDIFLGNNPGCRTVAVCYDFQILPHLPSMEHDVKPEIIVSDERVMIR